MRRSLTLLTVVVVLIGLIAVPAAADPPTIEPQEPFTFTAVDPCTGFEHDITVTITFFDHLGHNNNAVLRDTDRIGSTTSGYELLGGQFHLVDVFDTGFRLSQTDVWRNPDTGDMYQFHGKVRVVGNAAIVDEFSLRCLSGPTILP